MNSGQKDKFLVNIDETKINVQENAKAEIVKLRFDE